MKNIIAPLLISLLAIGCGSDQGTSDQGAKQPPVQNVNNPNPNQKPNPGQRESDAFAQLQKLDGNWVARDFQSQSQLAITVTRDEITVTKSQPGAQAPEMNVISVNSEGGKIVLLVAQDSSAEQPEAEYIFGVNNNSLTEFVRSASSSLVPAATYCKVGSTCAQTSRSNPVNTQMPARPQNGFGTQPQNGFGTQPPQNGFGTQPQNGFGTQPQNGFGTQPQNGFGMQPQNGFGMQPQNGFGMQPQNGFGMQPQNGFGTQPQNGFGMQPQNGFGMQPQNGFGGQMPRIGFR